MLKASAVNVVDITLMPAMPGTITLRSCWLPWSIAPKKTRNSSGSRKLKKAALGLRQKSRRSRRYWRQASVSPSAILASNLRGQLQVHVLQRRTGDRQTLEPLAAGEGVARQLMKEGRRVVSGALDQATVPVAVGD